MARRLRAACTACAVDPEPCIIVAEPVVESEMEKKKKDFCRLCHVIVLFVLVAVPVETNGRHYFRSNPHRWWLSAVPLRSLGPGQPRKTECL